MNAEGLCTYSVGIEDGVGGCVVEGVVEPDLSRALEAAREGTRYWNSKKPRNQYLTAEHWRRRTELTFFGSRVSLVWLLRFPDFGVPPTNCAAGEPPAAAGVETAEVVPLTGGPEEGGGGGGRIRREI